MTVQGQWSFNEKSAGYVEVKMAAEEEPEWWDVAFSGDMVNVRSLKHL